jgi:hypothetical protein
MRAKIDLGKIFQIFPSKGGLMKKMRVNLVIVLLVVSLVFLVTMSTPSTPPVSKGGLYTVLFGVLWVVGGSLLLWGFTSFVKYIPALLKSRVTPTTNEKTSVTNPPKSISVWTITLIGIIIGLVWFYVVPSHPEIVSKKVVEGLKIQDVMHFLAPYLLAPLLGILSYYCSKRGYKNFGFSVVVTMLACTAITLWIHPEFFRAVIEPYVGEKSMHQLVDNSGMRLYMLIITLFVVAVLMGYIIEAIIGVVLLLFLWSCL